ncbi:TPA: LOW QUALITY PROTEIN: hypothetical protein N0F65_005274 [Lagenidium giganteum]|uniref:CENP-V/GFA domain-containing protein n=1 Tax=Lagenidium giganteum TaxID=4803 RepID=A0AAV2Z1Y3_9STRA|nr:TPA: LOW QUALITY PROTEIN: hypothetical protein N0F65_005274 [Lagenidium giganteum]
MSRLGVAHSMRRRIKCDWVSRGFEGNSKVAIKSTASFTNMGGMVREVDRAIGAVSTLVVGISFLMVRCVNGTSIGGVVLTWCLPTQQLRRLLRKAEEPARREKADSTEDATDAYYQYVGYRGGMHAWDVVIDDNALCRSKYGQPKQPLFQHRGSCDCGSLRFFALAARRVEAFDDSNVLSCKKGRYPYLVVPTSCFDMIETSGEISIYEPQNSSSQHVFCGKCGVHIFHFDQTQSDYVAINVYCLEEENFDDIKETSDPKQLILFVTDCCFSIKIVFTPKGARPVFSSPQRLPAQIEQHMLTVVYSDFQKQLAMWANVEKDSQYARSIDDTRSTQSSSSSTVGRRFSSILFITICLVNVRFLTKWQCLV